MAVGAAVLVAGHGGDVRASGPTAAAPPLGSQAARGHAQFCRSCASCHGANGEGKRKVAPPLTGAKALPLTPSPKSKYRNMEFRTAQDVYFFASTRMPPSLLHPKPTCEGYWDIVAWLLSANGIPYAEPLGPHNACSVLMTNRAGAGGH